MSARHQSDSGQLRARAEERARAETLEKRIAALSPARRALFHQRSRASRKLWPLSYAQESLWILDRLHPGTTAYNCAHAVRIQGCLNVEYVRLSLREIGWRHEVLRTRIVAQDGQPWQVIDPPGELEFTLHDLGSIEDPQARLLQAEAIRDIEAQRPFDLSAGPLWRTGLIRLSPTDHVLLLNIHHIVCDAWSLGVLTSEFVRLYAARARSGSA